MLYLFRNSFKCQSLVTTIWKIVFSTDFLKRLTVVHETVAQFYDLVILQFAVRFMKRQCQSICQRDKCNWRRLTRNILAGSAEPSKILENIPDGECTWNRPHTVESFSASAPPLASWSPLPPASFLLCQKLKSQVSVLVKILHSILFFGFLFISSPHLLLSSCSKPVEDTGK